MGSQSVMNGKWNARALSTHFSNAKTVAVIKSCSLILSAWRRTSRRPCNRARSATMSSDKSLFPKSRSQRLPRSFRFSWRRGILNDMCPCVRKQRLRDCKLNEASQVREILTQLNAVLDRKLACVYCAVVDTRGSSPQKAGANMLVFPDGSQAGTLGGGCIEAEVKRRALRALGSNSGPEVSTFLLDEVSGWDDGLICGGRMTILFHPLAA